MKKDDHFYDGNSTHLRTNYPHLYDFVEPNITDLQLEAMESFDLRTRGRYFAVRNQMGCGACVVRAPGMISECTVHREQRDVLSCGSIAVLGLCVHAAERFSCACLCCCR